MIVVENLSSRYGEKVAVDGLDVIVQPGIVTGFLGSNGAGKSTTMRMIAALDAPTTGRVLVNGKDYRAAAAPMARLGILLEARAVHPGRSARNHLPALGQANGIGRRRADEVIEMAGLTAVAGKKAGGFSLGMGQRLGIASALLGDPRVMVLDEPVNGLDPDGVLWVRNLLKGLAAEGRTVFVSSHLMSETALTATRPRVLLPGGSREPGNHAGRDPAAVLDLQPVGPRPVAYLRGALPARSGLAPPAGRAPGGSGDLAAGRGIAGQDGPQLAAVVKPSWSIASLTRDMSQQGHAAR